MIAVSFIKEFGKDNKWDTDQQIIILCEFISHINKDYELKQFLEEKTKANNNLPAY